MMFRARVLLLLKGWFALRPEFSTGPAQRPILANGIWFELTRHNWLWYNSNTEHGQVLCSAWYPWYPLTPEIGDTGWKWWKQWEPWRTRKDSKYAGFQQT